MKILYIEDSVSLSDAVKHLLEKSNNQVDVIYDGETGLDYALSDIYDLIILDIMLPKLDGITIVKEVRKSLITVPILLLSAKGDLSDKIKGLDAGADDYLPKPFEVDELLARVRALSRRSNVIVEIDRPHFGDLILDTDNLKLICNDLSVDLTLKEKDVLELLMKRIGIATSKDYMIEKLWGFDSEAIDNHVEVYISFVRKKLTYLNSLVKIKTIRSVGYKLELETEVDSNELDN